MIVFSLTELDNAALSIGILLCEINPTQLCYWIYADITTVNSLINLFRVL